MDMRISEQPEIGLYLFPRQPGVAMAPTIARWRHGLSTGGL